MRSNLWISIWDYRCFVFRSSAFQIRKKKYVKRKKHLVQDLIPPLSMYIHMCTLYTYTNICITRFCPSGFFGPWRCLIPTPGLTSKYPICAVCVCMCVYTHQPAYTPTRVKNRQNTDSTPIFPSVKITPTPSNKCFYRLVEPPYPYSPILNETNCTYMRAYAHPVASVKQMFTLMFTTSV